MTQLRWSPELPRVNVNEDYELRYWSERFDVPKDETKPPSKKSALVSRMSPANSAAKRNSAATSMSSPVASET